MTDPPRETPDVETSSDAYAQRFAGAVGEWFLDVQARATLELLTPWPAASVLDVGGGHAQLARPLADAGYDVSVLGSDPACARRLQPLLADDRVRFQVGDLARAPFADGAFDVVVSYRLLPHLQRWRSVVTELCRLARHAVLVDYPTRHSVNAAAEALFGLKRGVEGDTRPFTVFDDSEVEAAFHASGFRPSARRPQFCFPMALHRALRSAGLARGLESLAAAVGATRRFGSPVILRAQR